MKYIKFSDQTVRSQIRNASLVKLEAVKPETTSNEEALRMLAIRLATGQIDQDAFDKVVGLLGSPSLENLL